jgi:type II secretory ATPase GspE/PulE/Tfp pilus assembly ATPase PilB-like protein
MAGAVKMKASDIHFEPAEEEVRMRFRIDGVCRILEDFQWIHIISFCPALK